MTNLTITTIGREGNGVMSAHSETPTGAKRGEGAYAALFVARRMFLPVWLAAMGSMRHRHRAGDPMMVRLRRSRSRPRR
jgi:hypothetical protein